jgi:hypothetical protein
MGVIFYLLLGVTVTVTVTVNQMQQKAASSNPVWTLFLGGVVRLTREFTPV